VGDRHDEDFMFARRNEFLTLNLSGKAASVRSVDRVHEIPESEQIEQTAAHLSEAPDNLTLSVAPVELDSDSPRREKASRVAAKYTLEEPISSSAQLLFEPHPCRKLSRNAGGEAGAIGGALG
jgi:hypothetical protein